MIIRKLENNKVVTNGGRVLAITSYGNTFEEAIKKSYQNINEHIRYKMKFYKETKRYNNIIKNIFFIDTTNVTNLKVKKL